jgi:hypothetical protein
LKSDRRGWRNVGTSSTALSSLVLHVRTQKDARRNLSLSSLSSLQTTRCLRLLPTKLISTTHRGFAYFLSLRSRIVKSVWRSLKR